MRKLWGGRFDGETDALILRLNNSLPFDRRLWRQDIEGSIAHATMLGATGILSPQEADQIVAGLQTLRADLEAGQVELPEDAEDVHAAVESLLRERIGPIAGKLHTARSRNDQVATDVRLYLRAECDALVAEIRQLQETLLDVAAQHFETVMPGYTHLQHAQPVVLAHHLLAYFWMLSRDVERLSACRGRVNRLPLGAAALAGTGFPIDREHVARQLQFDMLLENSLDAVSDRDFIAEFLACAAILMMHLSRLAEEIVLWNSPEFGFVILDDSVTTGSSIMPQKKNPDVAELVRGKTGRVYGNLTAILTVLKGLPLAYNKDLQEDKEPLFDTVDTLHLVLPALRKTLASARFQVERMREATAGDFSTATDLADYLVRQGMTFREAHEVVGRIVRHCIAHHLTLETLDVPTLQALCPTLADRASEVQAILSVQASVQSRQVRGGTAPQSVRVQWQVARDSLAGT
ncbi:MAG: argininosuccinate lyase [Chloroherpetonaceae bacterium]|nr:argininosuccinate lyase [Chthonomonadaceae bacterium]MDW8209176.1 argininosuccinate lyase [Chloroherpetonaceae bacterium]